MIRTCVMNWLMLVVSCMTVASSREKAFSPIRFTLMLSSVEEGTARGAVPEATGGGRVGRWEGIVPRRTYAVVGADDCPASFPASLEGVVIPPEGEKMFVHRYGAWSGARAADAG